LKLQRLFNAAQEFKGTMRMLGPAEINEYSLEIERLSAKAASLGIHRSREEIARRMILCEAAGIAPSEMDKYVLSVGAV
jgi:hypothetical protein